MSVKRFLVSALWIAIGGAIGAAILWSPDSLQISSWWWLVILITIACVFNAVPNWWATNFSTSIYFGGSWAIGGAIIWAWSCEPVRAWWQTSFPGNDNLWLMVTGLLMALGVFIASFYLVIERALNPDEFQPDVKFSQLWGARPGETFVVSLMSFIMLGGWFMLLLPQNYAHDTANIDRAVHALLFAWIMLWLGKLSATLKARSHHQDQDLLNPRYERALISNERWCDVSSQDDEWPMGKGE